ncbi:MAG: glycosyltransferase family 9 protein [Vicinamibacterales bacterium]
MKILLIRLRQIGDVVFTTPTIAALRRHFPAAHLTYVVEPAAAAVVEANPHLNEVVVARRRPGLGGTIADVALGLRLRRQRFDLAIDFHGGPRASLLAWLSGAPRRVGYDVPGRGWMYTDRVARPRELRPRHAVENQWDLLEALGLPPPSPSTFPAEMPVDAGLQTSVRDRLRRHGVPPGAAVVVVHVSAGNPFRRWPLPSFAEVGAALVTADSRVYVVVTSGPSEEDAAARVIEAARARVDQPARTRVVSCGELSLSELRALLETAALYIGGDSGPMHVASTSPAPMISLYGPTLPARSKPWRSPEVPAVAVEPASLPCRPCDQRVCVTGDFRCLTSIEPRTVIDAALAVLRQRRGRPQGTGSSADKIGAESRP